MKHILRSFDGLSWIDITSWGSHSQGARPVSDYQLNFENYWRSNVKSKKEKRHLKTSHLLSECFELLFSLLSFFSTRRRNIWSWNGKDFTHWGVTRVLFLSNNLCTLVKTQVAQDPLFRYSGNSSIYTFSMGRVWADF